MPSKTIEENQPGHFYETHALGRTPISSNTTNNRTACPSRQPTDVVKSKLSQDGFRHPNFSDKRTQFIRGCETESSKSFRAPQTNCRPQSAFLMKVVAGTRFKAANRPITYRGVELANEFSGRTVLAVSLSRYQNPFVRPGDLRHGGLHPLGETQIRDSSPGFGLRPGDPGAIALGRLRIHPARER